MVLAGAWSGVIKIDCCAHPRILGAKRLLQHNLFNGGSPGRMCVAVGGRFPVIVAGWLNGAVWPRQARLCGSVKTVHVIATVKQWPPFLCTLVPPPHSLHPSSTWYVIWCSFYVLGQRAQFNLGEVMVILRWDYIDWLDIIYILKMGKPTGSVFC